MNTGGRIRRFQIDEQSWVEESSAPWIWLRTTGRTHNWDSKMSEFQEGPNDFFKHIVWSLRNGWNISIPQRYCRLVPENCSKAISTTKWILLIFWFSSANKSYDYTYPAVYEVKIALYQRNNEHTLIEKYFIAKFLTTIWTSASHPSNGKDYWSQINIRNIMMQNYEILTRLWHRDRQ